MRIYWESAQDAGKAFLRSAWAMGVLLAAYPLLLLAQTVTAPLGLVGGMVYAVVMNAVAGTYLACLQDALAMRRPMGAAVVRSNLGRYTWDIVRVNFPIYLAMLVAALVAAPLQLALGVAVFFFLNPLPEMIGREQADGLALLREAVRFVLKDGIEWFLALALVLVPVAIGLGLDATFGFGGSFGFVYAGGTVFGAMGSGPAAAALGIAAVAATHLIMLFRGALYVRLSSSGRRGRAWQEHFR